MMLLWICLNFKITLIFSTNKLRSPKCAFYRQLWGMQLWWKESIHDNLGCACGRNAKRCLNVFEAIGRRCGELLSNSWKWKIKFVKMKNGPIRTSIVDNEREKGGGNAYYNIINYNILIFNINDLDVSSGNWFLILDASLFFFVVTCGFETSPKSRIGFKTEVWKIQFKFGKIPMANKKQIISRWIIRSDPPCYNPTTTKKTTFNSTIPNQYLKNAGTHTRTTLMTASRNF